MADNDRILTTTNDGQAWFVLRRIGGQVWLIEVATDKEYLTVQSEVKRQVNRWVLWFSRFSMGTHMVLELAHLMPSNIEGQEQKEEFFLDCDVSPTDNKYTTHPLQSYSVNFSLGRKNRLLGGFFISGAWNRQ